MDAVAWRIARTVYPVLATVAAVGICLNTTLLLTTIRTKSLRSTANILIGCCAFFDIIHQMGYFIQFPILFSDYYIDSYYCTCMQFLPELGLAAGAFCVLNIGVDRMLSILMAITYKRLQKWKFLIVHFISIALFAGWVGYLMIAYWTPKKLICSMPSPFHGDALGLRSTSIEIVNVASALIYFVTWQTVKRKGLSKHSKKVFVSITMVMFFEVTGWFVSTLLINLSRVIAAPERRPPFHYAACLFVNVGIAVKTIIYFSISTDYRVAIRAFLGMGQTSSTVGSSQQVESTVGATKTVASETQTGNNS